MNCGKNKLIDTEQTEELSKLLCQKLTDHADKETQKLIAQQQTEALKDLIKKSDLSNRKQAHTHAKKALLELQQGDTTIHM